MHFLESIGFVQKENDRGFKMIPAIVMMALLIAFFGTTIYLFASGLD